MQPLLIIPLSIVLVADPQPTNISAWQAAIPLFAAIVTALFGFIGVLVGLRWNAKQAEKTEQRLRRNKREVLRISLWAELSSLAHVIEEERLATLKRTLSPGFRWLRASRSTSKISRT
ncbi:hypothetical protein HZZ13_00705 [Bradyrhizobium sp. CNPSo 4010]|uniref:LapA family protein n=1 Tax=Bradyrhizobium agreste TaxID=2751811 RepID=A0ABS0PGV9_9BRAD|nr:hypothetical protein [Bradyrhizobium agreste]MBH5396340.1 hypothetical protein [Bradyrhizobium agreste]